MYANMFRTSTHVFIEKPLDCRPWPSSLDSCPVKSYDRSWYAVRRDGRLHC